MSPNDVLMDKTFVTADEEYLPAVRIGEQIETALARVLTDSYNVQYVVTVTVRKIADDTSVRSADDD